jgi:predicted RNase H-like nuclease (RuvC/YqgF family)
VEKREGWVDARAGFSPEPVHSHTELISAHHLHRTELSTRTSALDARIFGVDVQSGDVRGDAPSYALVVFDGDVVERDVVSRRKLLRRVDDEEPAMLATDNMYELAADKDQLVHFLRGLPEETKLVQVTGDERPEPLSRVAKRHGVPYGKPAMEEAEAAARLASRSVGYEVSAFTDETEVKVARGRSTGGGGGWSEDRYTRRIHGSVKRATREVESELDDAGLEYDRDVTEKYGGYANAVFTVQARPEDIPVSSRRSGDTRVEIEPVRRDGIEFVPLARRRDRVFVGIDPGTTTAVALVALDGRVLDVMSTRTADTSEVIEWIIEHGRPVVVAADVTPMPDTVERIRASFDAAGWTPDSDLPIDEKQHRTREEGYENDHERDAMAAALFAHDDHADQIQRVTEEIPRELDRGDVVSRVVGDDESLTAVVADMTETEEPEPEPTTHDPRELTAEEQRIKDLEAQVDRLQAHVADLEAELDEKDDTIAEYEERLSEARREERQEAQERREVTRLQWENDRLETELDEHRERADELEGKLERLKDLWKLDHSNVADVDGGEDLLAVKPVEQFTVDAIEAADDEYGIARGDIVYLRDASGAGRRTAELLADFEPRVVLRSGGLSDAADEVLFDHQIPVGPAEDVTIREVDELAIASESDVEAVIEDWRDRKADREREQTETMVDSIISEHRADRD